MRRIVAVLSATALVAAIVTISSAVANTPGAGATRSRQTAPPAHWCNTNGVTCAEPFQKWAQEAEENAAALEAALRAGARARADLFLDRAAAGCATCHAHYRNVPQGGS